MRNWSKVVFPLAILVISFGIAFSLHYFTIPETETGFVCKENISFSHTDITCSSSFANYLIRSTSVWEMVTDQLDLYDSNDNLIGRASDSYNFLSQDDHQISVNGLPTIYMNGEFTFWGNQNYSILNVNYKEIGTLASNIFNTSATLKDRNGTEVAIFKRGLFSPHYIVEIVNSSNYFTTEQILLLFASYYSDYTADES